MGLNEHMWFATILQRLSGYGDDKNSLFIKAYNRINKAYFYFNLLLLFVKIPLCENVEVFLMNISISLMYGVMAVSMYFVQNVNCLKLFRDITDYEKKMMMEQNTLILPILLKHSRKNNKINIYLYVQSFSFVILLFYSFTAVSKGGQIVIYHQYYPFEVLDYYWWVVLNQTVYIFLPCLSRFVYVRVSMVTFVTYLNARLDILFMYITHLKKLPENLKKASKQEKQDYFLTTTKFCLKEHISICQYVKDVRKHTNIFIFMEFLVSSIQFGSMWLRVLVRFEGDTQRDIITTFLYFVVVLIPMVIIYKHAEDIKTNSVDVGTKLFQLTWYDFNDDNIKMIMMMVMRSQKDLALFVGPLFEMDLETLVKVFKGAFSYFAFMKTIHGIYND